MSPLESRRVNFCPDADVRLRRLKGQTGITPNLLCRIGFCISLDERSPPVPDQYPAGPRDINRETLLGEFDVLFVSLLRQRLVNDGLTWADHAVEQFNAHMNRGVLLLDARADSLAEVLLKTPAPLT